MTKTNIVEFPQCDNGKCKNFEKNADDMKYIDNCFSPGCEAFCNLVEAFCNLMDTGVRLHRQLHRKLYRKYGVRVDE